MNVTRFSSPSFSIDSNSCMQGCSDPYSWIDSNRVDVLIFFDSPFAWKAKYVSFILELIVFVMVLRVPRTNLSELNSIDSVSKLVVISPLGVLDVMKTSL